MKKLKDGKANALGEFAVRVDADYFTTNQFRLGSSATQTFILLLSQNKPKSLLSGADVDLENVLQKYNRSEFHHIFPRAYLKKEDIADERINSLVNFCFINSIENKLIGGKKPSLYRSKMPTGKDLKGVLDHSFLDESLFDDNFDEFQTSRSVKLAEVANQLMA